MKEEPASILLLSGNFLLPLFSASRGAGDLSFVDGIRVVFDAFQWAPAPGQSAVLYDGETVIGGGVIKK